MTQFYDNIMPAAFAGMKADSRFDHVETSAAGEAIPCGVFVKVDDKGVATVANTTSGYSIFGVALHTHTQIDGYQKGDAVNVLRQGAAWVKCAAGDNSVINSTANLNANGEIDSSGGVSFTTSDNWIIRDIRTANGVKLAKVEKL